MATTARVDLAQREPKHPPSLLFAMGWMVVVGIGLIFLATQVFQIEAFFNLGTFVPQFLGIVLGLTGILSLVTVPFLWTLNNNWRIVAMILNFFGLGFGVLYAGHVSGLFLGIDTLALNIYRNAWLLLGFPIGYALVWLSRRMDDLNSAKDLVQKIGLGVMGAALVAILLTSGWLQYVASNPGAGLGQLFNVPTIATIAVTVIFAVVGSIFMRNGTLFGETILQREAWQGWLFLLPNFVNFLLFFAMPLILSFYLSFTDYNAISRADWIGFENYRRLLSLDFETVPSGAAPTDLAPRHFEVSRFSVGNNDVVIAAESPGFWRTLSTTFRYCILLLTFSIIPAFGLAMLLNSKIPGIKFFRAVYFLPSIAAVVGVAMIWQWLYNPIIGFINYWISSIVGALNGLGLAVSDPNIQWLTDDNVMLLSVVIMASWQVIGFNTVILLAGLQGVPKDLIEASTVDGAGPWLRFRRIILPLLGPTTFFVIVTTLISGMQAFSEMYTLFGVSTSDARLTVVYYLYLSGFQQFDMGFASATAWVLFVVIFIITVIQFRISRSSEAYRD
jgi:ABC-type sugar transport system permease subunit